jgi:hypothetical protein
VSSGSIAVHPDSSVQLLAEEATLVENLDAKVNLIIFINMNYYNLFDIFRLAKMHYPMANVD